MKRNVTYLGRAKGIAVVAAEDNEDADDDTDDDAAALADDDDDDDDDDTTDVLLAAYAVSLRRLEGDVPSSAGGWGGCQVPTLKVMLSMLTESEPLTASPLQRPKTWTVVCGLGAGVLDHLADDPSNTAL